MVPVLVLVWHSASNSFVSHWTFGFPILYQAVLHGVRFRGLQVLKVEKAHSVLYRKGLENDKIQGITKPAFGKPCLCLSDARHFRVLGGLEERNPLEACFGG